MKSSRSRLWIIILGGVIGLILGVALPYLLIQTGWKRLSYAGIDPASDRIISVVGYNYQNESLYIKGQTQKIYECSFNANSWSADWKCHEATTKPLRKQKVYLNAYQSRALPSNHLVASFRGWIRSTVLTNIKLYNSYMRSLMMGVSGS